MTLRTAGEPLLKSSEDQGFREEYTRPGRPRSRREAGKRKALAGRRDPAGPGPFPLKDGTRSPTEAKEVRECTSMSRKEESVAEPDIVVLGEMEASSPFVGAASVKEKRAMQAGGA